MHNFCLVFVALGCLFWGFFIQHFMLMLKANREYKEVKRQYDQLGRSGDKKYFGSEGNLLFDEMFCLMEEAHRFFLYTFVFVVLSILFFYLSIMCYFGNILDSAGLW